MNYEDLLKKGKKELPQKTVETSRLEVPKVIGHIQGNKTIVTNFHQIASLIGRDPNHLLKFILKELAAPGELSSTALSIGTKVPASKINDKIAVYVKSLVYCPECKRPDTKLVKESNITFIKCSACGAKSPVKIKV